MTADDLVELRALTLVERLAFAASTTREWTIVATADLAEAKTELETLRAALEQVGHWLREASSTDDMLDAEEALEQIYLAVTPLLGAAYLADGAV